MVNISEVSKSFGGRTLFEDASLVINRQDRIGLVGPNGAGKSTLFSMILGQQEPDKGEISTERNVTVGYLPQESAPVGEETVLQVATAIDHDGDYQIEARAKKILAGLSFRQTDFDRPAKELSGGWVMRAHLARLLVQQPDLLMLDEPTNHLDLDSLLWFQGYLKEYPGAVLIISHDREFLNALVDSIVEIRFKKLIRYRGNFEDYLTQRQANEANLLAAYKNQQREIGRMMRFVERFRAKNTKAAQAQSKLKQIERMEKVEAPTGSEKEISFSFPQPQRSGLKVITLSSIHHSYGSNVVYRGMDFEAEREQRIVLVGPNGAGKSTLLKLLAGVIPVQSGERKLGHNVKSGYYSQYRVDMLNPERTVFEEALDTPQRVTEQFVRTVLGSFLFQGDDIYKKVRVLSGGEKSRLALVKLLLDPPNLLLMDEPTTHLDMASIDALVDALDQFEGTLIFISHDVYFIRALANRVVHVNNGKLTAYPGDYQYYLDKTATVPSAPAKAPERPTPRTKSQKRIEAEERQELSRHRRDQQKAVADLEARIHQLESRQAELAAELEKPETYEKSGLVMQFNRELTQVTDDLERLTAEWETAASKLTELEP